jgi:hypothetical protein
MRLMFRNAIAAALLLVLTVPASSQTIDDSLKELRQTFTLRGKPVPPAVFADFGDADMSGANSIRVTIDLLAAMDSNLYSAGVNASPNGWVSQKKAIGAGADKAAETTAYKFNGVTRNGLLLVTAAVSGGGSGDYLTLHILDAAAARAFDSEGKTYDRLNLTVLRSIPLGDRWKGAIEVTGDNIAITTEPGEPNNSNPQRETRIVEAVRP